MNAKTALFVVALLSLVSTVASRGDDQQQSAEARLRAALRDSMLQLRDAQNQVVTLQAAQAQSDKDKADLQGKVDALTAELKMATDQAAADKAAADKAVADLKAQVDDQAGQIARLNEGLKQWKGAYAQVDELAKAKEAARMKLTVEDAELKRIVEDREEKNLALFKLSNEILNRYEKFGLGDALAAKEPFVGLSRVKLETLVQDYKNKILDQAVTSGQPVPETAPLPAEKKAGAATASN